MGPSAVIASLLIKLGLDPSGVEQGASAASRAMGGLTKHGTLAAAGMGFAVGDFVAQSAQRMMQFDDQMRQVFSILPGISQDAMDKMASQVRDLSKEYGVATDVVIPGLYDALSSGVPQDNVFAFMETAQKMAVAGVADTQQSVNLLTQVMNAYRLEAEDMVGVSDQMFMAVNKGVTTIPELSSALSSVTPIASSMGIGINEVLAAITAMTLQGSSTAESVTMMRSSLVALMKPLPALRLGLANAGYETGQAAIEALGYQGAMELMRDISEKTGTTLPKLTGRIEGTSAVLQLTGQNAEAARQALEDVTTAAGTTDSAFRIMQGGIGGTVRRMQAWMQDLSLTVGQAIEPIAPLFLAFGPQMGRWLGRGIGAGLGVAMKGIGGIVARAMPGLAATMTQIGADAGGSLAKGLGQSIATSIKSAGWRRLAFGGIAMAAGAALATGAFGDFGGIEKLAGSLLSIAGAFAVGGPVLGAIVALTMALQELGNFLGTVDRAQSDLDAKVAGIAQQSGKEALANLQNLTKTLR
ncbi:MAG TPA: phage tail tape measure protein, partial [Candidatus Limnocylindrales bacterium]|nr:phage tail tape measure protein [Candidatus Limnocylindrales bacterium]